MSKLRVVPVSSVVLCVLAILTVTLPAFARIARDTAAAPRPGERIDDVPARAPEGFARSDTVSFGYYQVIGENTYAVQGGIWTWDHNAPDPLEGWYSVDNTAAPHPWFRQITAASWNGHDNAVAAPIIDGVGSAWVGALEDEADHLCWDAGLGYGNLWCQRLTSPTLTYGGTGAVDLAFSYFNDSEYHYDYTKAILSAAGTEILLNNPGFTGRQGNPPSGPWASYARTITQGELGGAGSRPFTIRFEFTSDVAWSDQDGNYATSYGPFGVDDVLLSGDVVEGSQAYQFETDLQGWTASSCPGVGSFFAAHPISDYVIQDPCACRLSGNVVGLHDDLHQHPANQHEGIYSPIVDHTNLQTYNRFLTYWDQYAEMPQANGVVYMPAWSYYPYTCPASGETQWSPRMGQDVWYYVGDMPICYRTSVDAQAWGIPSSVDYLRFVYEIAYDCNNCSGITNFSPLIDNVRIRFTTRADAPALSFDLGGQFQDGFPQEWLLDVSGTGNADITRNLHYGNPPPDDADRLGDSLVVAGPIATPSKRWEAKLWFRVKREGPAQLENSAYRAWKERVRKGLQIVGPRGSFTWGYMDSVEVPGGVYRNKFCSRFREGDPSYGSSEMAPDNEIIMDRILTPGTKIEYFVTGNYTCTPSACSYLPDTTGRFYNEFEILPSYRDIPNGYYGFPCLLYVDAFNRGSQFYIESALNRALNGAVQDSAEIPDPTTWDRYDYLDASSGWKAPLFRNTGGNAGATVPQLLGYKAILVSTGTYSTGCMETRDWQGFDAWLTANSCGANTQLQGWWGSGSNLSQIIGAGFTGWPPFLNDLGATAVCGRYSDPGCPPDDDGHNDQQYCVRLDASAGGPWEPAVPIDVFGNWCPPQFSLDVLGATGTGVGNKGYHKLGDTYVADYAQVTNDQSASGYKYRTVLDGYSLHQLSASTGTDDPNPGSNTDCPNTTAAIVDAGYAEVGSAIRWLLNINGPLDLGTCNDPCWICCGPTSGVEDAAGAPVNRLYQNSPNPFNPRTLIRFSLAQAGWAQLIIYDAGGRRVRTLADSPQAAGPHTLVWDGTDDGGHRVASGIYWSQLTAGEYSSNRKMVVVN